MNPKTLLWGPQDLPGNRGIQQKEGTEGKELAQACSCQEPIVQATELEIPNLKVRDRSPPWVRIHKNHPLGSQEHEF